MPQMWPHLKSVCSKSQCYRCKTVAAGTAGGHSSTYLTRLAIQCELRGFDSRRVFRNQDLHPFEESRIGYDPPHVLARELKVGPAPASATYLDGGRVVDPTRQ